MKIAVPVKHVPDPASPWKFAADNTLDRAAVDSRLSELDEYAIEQAVRLVEGGLDAQITFITMGPAKAADGLRKALAMGGHAGVHIKDDALHGSDALSTAKVLAAAIRKTGFDLVLCGMSSTDAEMSVVPTMLAALLDVPAPTFAGSLAVSGSTVRITRSGDTAIEEITAELPAVVTVTDQTGEARYPSFKNIIAAKKKPVTTWTLADLGITPAEVGTGAAATEVRSVRPQPPRAAGVVVVDEGDAEVALANFLAAKNLI